MLLIFKQLTLQNKKATLPQNRNDGLYSRKSTILSLTRFSTELELNHIDSPKRLKGDAFYFDVYKGLIAHQYLSFTLRGDEGMNDIEVGGSCTN